MGYAIVPFSRVLNLNYFNEYPAVTMTLYWISAVQNARMQYATVLKGNVLKWGMLLLIKMFVK